MVKKESINDRNLRTLEFENKEKKGKESTEKIFVRSLPDDKKKNELNRMESHYPSYYDAQNGWAQMMPPPAIYPQQEEDSDSESDSDEQEHTEKPTTSKEEKTKSDQPQSKDSVEQHDVLSTFIRFTGKFLRRVAAAFDDCEKLKAKLEDFETLIEPYPVAQEIACKKYHNQMKDYYDACANKNPAPFLEEKIQILKDIDFREKWLEITDTEVYSKEQINTNINNLWGYINEMNKYARLYNQMPKRVISKIENMANDIVRQVESNEKGLTDFNIIDIGQKIVNGSSTQEISELMQNMGNIYNAVGGMDSLNQMSQAGIKMPNLGNLGELMQKAQNDFASQSAEERAEQLEYVVSPKSTGKWKPKKLSRK
jgi:hypothetical protein